MPTRQANRCRARGATLLELLIALVIVSVLATLAVAAYRRYALQANRTDARAALLALAAAQEKHYLTCNEYAASLDDTRPSGCSPATLNFPARSERGLYTLTMTAADAIAWTATAVVADGSPQSADSRCRVLQLDSTGLRTATAVDGTATSANCWTR
jgi:type IV pilus assembly protein PilE